MSGCGSILHRLETAPPTVVTALSAVFLVGVGFVDFITGAEISSSVFYVFPVALAAWCAGRTWASGLSTLAAATWYVADGLAGATYSAAWIPVWNAGVRLAFFILIALLLARLRGALDEQRALAEVDPLTGLANSRRFLATVEAEVARSARYRRPVSVAYIDLDGFKAVNDGFGHAVGDEVLAAVGHTLRDHVRATDLPARLGGDEFAVLFPETDAASVADAVEKIRVHLHAAARRWPVGFSMGVFTSGGEVGNAEELIRRADDLMYQVKRTGKGRTTFQGSAGYPSPPPEARLTHLKEEGDGPGG